ncbi:MAG: hypothetical protein L7F78_14415, partial [Syntrophales bacterium LBB04]|nr:hypothetical protein [Syntrophales bacterium LBB04]
MALSGYHNFKNNFVLTKCETYGQASLNKLDREKVKLEHKIFDLSSLVQAGKAFDNLLGAGELYKVFTSIVQERFGLGIYALFIVNDEKNQFEMVQG